MENEDRLTLYRLTNDVPATAEGVRATADAVTVHHLITVGELSPGALNMGVHDVLHQFNNVNGGELWLTEEDAPQPVICRRTGLNSDGTEPELWAFFEDADDADIWLVSGQVDIIETITGKAWHS